MESCRPGQRSLVGGDPDSFRQSLPADSSNSIDLVDYEPYHSVLGTRSRRAISQAYDWVRLVRSGAQEPPGTPSIRWERSTTDATLQTYDPRHPATADIGGLHSAEPRTCGFACQMVRTMTCDDFAEILALQRRMIHFINRHGTPLPARRRALDTISVESLHRSESLDGTAIRG